VSCHIDILPSHHGNFVIGKRIYVLFHGCGPLVIHHKHEAISFVWLLLRIIASAAASIFIVVISTIGDQVYVIHCSEMLFEPCLYLRRRHTVADVGEEEFVGFVEGGAGGIDR